MEIADLKVYGKVRLLFYKFVLAFVTDVLVYKAASKHVLEDLLLISFIEEHLHYLQKMMGELMGILLLSDINRLHLSVLIHTTKISHLIILVIPLVQVHEYFLCLS